MYRITKPAGFGNIVVEEVPTPTCGPRQILVETQVSLISRGSEILRRYMHDEAIDPAIMGYSVAGRIREAGGEVDAAAYPVGAQASAVLPHAQVVRGDVDAMEGSQVWPVGEELSPEQIAFIPLCTSAVTWAEVSGIRPGDTVVVLGQGLVGSLVMQAARAYNPGRLIAVDALPQRCATAAQLGADGVLNAGEVDPVAAVLEATGGQGAQVVMDCVGGQAGVRSFAQAQEMCAVGGTLHLIGLYHGEPLPLDAGRMQRRRLIGGHYQAPPRPQMVARAVAAVAQGALQVEPLITHRFPFGQAKAAYDLLYTRPAEALGVLLDWRT